MDFAKKSNGSKRALVGGERSRNVRSGLVGGFSESGTGVAAIGSRAFADDFNGEHSVSDASISLMAISARAEGLERAVHRKPPSCAYIG